jgi:hypothetical protein
MMLFVVIVGGPPSTGAFIVSELKRRERENSESYRKRLREIDPATLNDEEQKKLPAVIAAADDEAERDRRLERAKASKTDLPDEL